MPVNEDKRGCDSKDRVNARSVFLITIPLFVLAHLSHHLVPALITPLLPMIRDSLSLSYTRAGLLVSGFTITYGVAQLPGGWLGDIFGYSTLILAGISGVAVFGLLFGLTASYIPLLLFLVLMGISGGGYHPSASPLVSQAAGERLRGRALGIHQIGGTASYFIAPLIAVGIARVFGWRGSFILLSSLVFLYGILFYTLLRRWGYGGVDRRETPGDETDRGGRTRPLAKCIPVIIVSSSVQIFVSSSVSFLPLYIVDSLSGSKETAAALLSVSHSAGLWAGPLAGFASDRVGKKPIILFTAAISAPLVFLLNHVSLGAGIVAVLLFFGVAQYMSMPVTEAYLIGGTSRKNRSTVLGVYYFLSRGGPGLSTALLGWLIDRRGFAFAFNLAALIMGAVFTVCTVLIAKNGGWRE
ncbi:MAG: MFS transporter [Spirochaetes bacterium]|nr:MFS transporter [Spirochaetota bacterium]